MTNFPSWRLQLPRSHWRPCTGGGWPEWCPSLVGYLPAFRRPRGGGSCPWLVGSLPVNSRLRRGAPVPHSLDICRRFAGLFLPKNEVSSCLLRMIMKQTLPKTGAYRTVKKWLSLCLPLLPSLFVPHSLDILAGHFLKGLWLSLLFDTVIICKPNQVVSPTLWQMSSWEREPVIEEWKRLTLTQKNSLLLPEHNWHYFIRPWLVGYLCQPIIKAFEIICNHARSGRSIAVFLRYISGIMRNRTTVTTF